MTDAALDRRLDRMENQLERLTEALIKLASHDEKLTTLVESLNNVSIDVVALKENHAAITRRVDRIQTYLNIALSAIGLLGPVISSGIVLYAQRLFS